MDLLTLKLGLFYVLSPLLNRQPVPWTWKKTKKCASYNVADSGDTVQFDLEDGIFSVTALSPSIFRVIFTRQTDPDYFTWSIACHDKTKVHIEEKNRFVHIKPESESGIEALFDLNTTGVSFFFHNQQLHSELNAAHWNKGWLSSLKQSPVKEKYLGFGQKTGPLFKNMRKMKMWNTDDPRVAANSDPIYQSCPFMIGLRDNGFAHGIFFDNSHFSLFRLGKKNASTKAFYASQGGPLCYYVIGGPTLKDVVSRFTRLTGRYPLPPRWVLGHHHSRWLENESEDNMKILAEDFRKHQIPCDVLHIDIGHMRGYRCFTWDPVAFPHPDKLIDSLHDDKFKVVVIADPGIKRDDEFPVYKEGFEKGYFCTDDKGKVYHAPVWPGDCAFIDYSNPEAGRWWGSLFKFYTQSGIDGFWNDMNEPSLFTHVRTLPDSIVHKGGEGVPRMSHRRLHNSYSMLMVKATAAGLDTLNPDMRRFLFCRSSYAGVQQYASTWTGDNTSNWEHLRLSIPMVLNMGLSGQTMTGPDIGGFWKNTTPELMIRWMQMGVFYPFCRNHTSNHTIPQELWKLGEDTLSISRQYLTLRYTLIPYFYTYLRESCERGVPLMRPLFLEYSQDQRCYEPDICETQFLSGPFFLIAPILEPGCRMRKVYLPEGNKWFDFWNNQLYEGGKTYNMNAPIDVMPVFIKAGSVIPMAPPVLVTDDIIKKKIILAIYADNKISGELYLDDGKSMEYREGKYSLIECRGSSSPGKISMTCKRVEGDLNPILCEHPGFTFIIHFEKQINKITDVSLDGILLNKEGDQHGAWVFENNKLEINISKCDIPISIDVRYE